MDEQRSGVVAVVGAGGFIGSNLVRALSLPGTRRSSSCPLTDRCADQRATVVRSAWGPTFQPLRQIVGNTWARRESIRVKRRPPSWHRLGDRDVCAQRIIIIIIIIEPVRLPLPLLLWSACRPSADIWLPDALRAEAHRLGLRAVATTQDRWPTQPDGSVSFDPSWWSGTALPDLSYVHDELSVRGCSISMTRGLMTDLISAPPPSSLHSDNSLNARRTVD